jgi:hypothetical protein
MHYTNVKNQGKYLQNTNSFKLWPAEKTLPSDAVRRTQRASLDPFTASKIVLSSWSISVDSAFLENIRKATG